MCVEYVIALLKVYLIAIQAEKPVIGLEEIPLADMLGSSALKQLSCTRHIADRC